MPAGRALHTPKQCILIGPIHGQHLIQRFRLHTAVGKGNGRNIKTVPAEGNAGEYKPVVSRKDRAGQQPGADGHGIMLEGSMNPYIHEAEKIADMVALHAIKTGGAIQHQHFEFMFVVLRFELFLDAPLSGANYFE